MKDNTPARDELPENPESRKILNNLYRINQCNCYGNHMNSTCERWVTNLWPWALVIKSC